MRADYGVCMAVGLVDFTSAVSCPQRPCFPLSSGPITLILSGWKYQGPAEEERKGCQQIFELENSHVS